MLFFTGKVCFLGVYGGKWKILDPNMLIFVEIWNSNLK